MSESAPPTGVRRGARVDRPSTDERATAQVQLLREMLTEAQGPVLARFDTLDASMGAMSGQIESIDARLVRVESRQDDADRAAADEAVRLATARDLLGLPETATAAEVQVAAARRRRAEDGGGLWARIMADAWGRRIVMIVVAYLLAYLAAALGMPLPADTSGALPTTAGPKGAPTPPPALPQVEGGQDG